ncbi:MAG: DUF883 domain-containing protein [Steroidobacteraceae bacterium]|nr:DUF883 domain-containing protein [Steroidobacteraceae bacterium]
MTIQAKNFENGARAAADTTVVELTRVVAQAEELLKTLGEEGGAAVEAVRQRVQRTVSQAKVRLADASDRVRERAVDASKATDRYVHDNPWRSIAYGAAAGAAVALIASALLRRE